MSNTKTAVIDETKSNTLLNKVFEDISGTYITLMCCIGDRLELFKKLEANGPATSIDLSKSDTERGYARELEESQVRWS
jgi:hypothetical protein